MNGGAADLDGDDGIERSDGSLKRFEVRVFVWEDTEAASVNPQADTGMHVLCGGLKPRATLGLHSRDIRSATRIARADV